MNIEQRIKKLDWQSIEEALNEFGYGKTPPLLSSAECEELINLYDEDRRFRSRVVMERHNFGIGEYKYFNHPLPAAVTTLRASFYPQLASIANRWNVRLGGDDIYPAILNEFLEQCRLRDQTKPTPLMLRYTTGGYNCMHQDLYGEIAFPLQAACVLNQHGHDYTGGEFLLSEQRPRAQTRGEAITIEQGEFIIFPNRYRPVRGTRGDYRVMMRHGVSRLRSGIRYCLGVIFHDAK